MLPFSDSTERDISDGVEKDFGDGVITFLNGILRL
jgi:hypothetical protein